MTQQSKDKMIQQQLDDILNNDNIVEAYDIEDDDWGGENNHSYWIYLNPDYTLNDDNNIIHENIDDVEYIIELIERKKG